MLGEQERALALREALVEAPVFKLLTAAPAGRAALGRGEEVVRRWSKQEGDLTEASLVAAARPMLGEIDASAGTALALVVVPEEETGGEYRNVHMVVTDGERTDYLVRGFDLRIAVGFELVAAAALELLRRRLENDMNHQDTKRTV